MKYLTIALVIATIVAQVLGKHVSDEHSRAKRSIDSKLKDFLQVKLRKMLKTGNPSVGLPILDPLDQPKIAFKIDEKKARANVTVNDLHVEGISGYKVDVAKISLLSRKATVGLTFPVINARGKYTIKGVAMDDVDVYGDGLFGVIVKDFKVHAVVAVGVVGGVKVKSIKLKISLGSLQLKATGIFNDENTSILLSEIISDMAPQLLADYHDEVTTTASNVLIEMANVFLKGKSLADIIAILG